MTGAPHRAIFLSYASQDAEAARCICEALRVSGVEVWFDADGGLEHGDEWDQKIRRQIKECVLFIPVISAATQAREEGYFRIEWELAAQRAMAIASGVPFILPVVIDDTREPDALVPDRFRMVQWTRLPGGVVSADVQARFLKLWSHRAGILKHQSDVGRGLQTPPSDIASADAAGSGDPALQSKARPRFPTTKWSTAMGAAALVMAFGLGWWALQSRGKPRAANRPTAVTIPVPPDAARQLRQARELFYDPASARNEFALAESQLRRAVDLAPEFAEVWAASALLNHYFWSRGYDASPQRLVRSQSEAERALHLNAAAGEALLALGLHYGAMNDPDRARAFLTRAQAAMPENPRVYVAQSSLLQRPGQYRRNAEYLLDAAQRLPRNTELYYYAGLNFHWARGFDQAAAMFEKSIATEPFWRAFVQRASTEHALTADPEKMLRWLEQVPALKRDEPRTVCMRWQAAMLRRDGNGAVAALQAVAVEYFEDNFFNGPKSYLLAQSLELSGRPERALEQWQAAERVVRDRLVAKPGNGGFRAQLAVCLAAQKRAEEARELADGCWREQAEFLASGLLPVLESVAHAYAILGDAQKVAEVVNTIFRHEGDLGLTPAMVAREPRWDGVRDSAAFQKLLADSPVTSATTSRPDVPARSAEANLKSAMADKSVAVLAFANQSADPANEYFSDGIADELLTVLQKIPGLRVAARTSAWSFKGKNPTAQEVGEKLGMANVVEGSVQKIGNRVKITARLSRAATNDEVWSKSYGPIELTDVFATQSEIAQAIVVELRGRFSGEALPSVKSETQALVQAAMKGGTKNPEAHRLYLQGRFLTNQASIENLAKAAEYFRRATELDPKFALAWAAQARAISLRALFADGSLTELATARGKSDQAIARAVELEPDLVEGWIARVENQFAMELDWQGAHKSLQRALALAPANATVVAIASRQARTRGELAKSAELARQAAELDPVDAEIHWHLGKTLASLGRLNAAEAEFRKALDLNPATLATHRHLAFVLVRQGRYAEALTEARKEKTDWSKSTGIAIASWAGGNRAQADAALADLMRLSEICSYQIAQVHATRGDSDRAFEWLERAWSNRDSGIAESRADYFLTSLHADPRWPVLLRKIGLHDEQLK